MRLRATAAIVRRLKRAAGATCLLAIFGSGAKPPEALVTFRSNLSISQTLGVNIHSIKDWHKELTMIHEAGFKTVRLDGAWASVERARGEYDWSKLDYATNQLRRHRLRPLIILAYSNPIYETQLGHDASKVAAPATSNSRLAYARWAARLAQRYSSALPILELWNEPNLTRFWLPTPSPLDYISLAGVACPAIKRVSPKTIIVGPGLANAPETPLLTSTFLDKLSTSSASNCLTAISVHPYLHRRQVNDGPNWWLALKQHYKAISGKQPEFISSESGISTYSNRINPEEQAEYLVKMFVGNAASNIPLSVWYDWRDDGEKLDDPEHHFGLLSFESRKKPALEALRAMVSLLSFSSQICLVKSSAFTAAVFSGTGVEKVAVTWSNDQGSGRKVPARASANRRGAVIYDLYGRQISSDTPRLFDNEYRPTLFYERFNSTESGCELASKLTMELN